MEVSRQIRICDFTTSEIKYFRENCNFTGEEELLFELRNKYFTLEQIAEKMNISPKTAYRINKRVKQKIIRVQNMPNFRPKPDL